MNSGTELVFLVQNVEFSPQQNTRKSYTWSHYLGLEYAPNPLSASLGSLKHSPDPLAELKGPTSKGRGKEGARGKKGRGKEEG